MRISVLVSNTLEGSVVAATVNHRVDVDPKPLGVDRGKGPKPLDERGRAEPPLW